MASQAEHSVLDLANPSEVKAWLQQLAALARSKVIQDVAADADTEMDVCYGITDVCISCAGLLIVLKLSLIAAQCELESLSFTGIKQLVLQTIQPNVVGSRCLEWSSLNYCF